jgi:hypothetical protein
MAVWDNGATHTCVNDISLLTDVTLLSPPQRLGGVASCIYLTHVGRISSLPSSNGINIAYYSPAITVNLFSLNYLLRRGCSYSTCTETLFLTVRHHATRTIINYVPLNLDNNLHFVDLDQIPLNLPTNPPRALLSAALRHTTFQHYNKEQISRVDAAEALHIEMHHPSDDVLAHACKTSAFPTQVTPADITLNRALRGPCPQCEAGKLHGPSPSPPSSTTPPATAVGQVISIDVNTLPSPTPEGRTHEIVFVDEFSGHLTVLPSASKAAPHVFQTLYTYISHLNSYGHVVSTIHTDSEAIFISLEARLGSVGVRMQYSPPATHAHRVERYIRVLRERTRCSLASLPYILPKKLFIYLHRSIAYALNSLPNSRSFPHTPFQIVTNTKPSALPFPFGAVCMVNQFLDKIHRQATLLATPPNAVAIAEIGLCLGFDAKSQSSIFLVANGLILPRRPNRSCHLIPFGYTPQEILRAELRQPHTLSPLSPTADPFTPSPSDTPPHATPANDPHEPPSTQPSDTTPHAAPGNVPHTPPSTPPSGTTPHAAPVNVPHTPPSTPPSDTTPHAAPANVPHSPSSTPPFAPTPHATTHNILHQLPSTPPAAIADTVNAVAATVQPARRVPPTPHPLPSPFQGLPSLPSWCSGTECTSLPPTPDLPNPPDSCPPTRRHAVSGPHLPPTNTPTQQCQSQPQSPPQSHTPPPPHPPPASTPLPQHSYNTRGRHRGIQPHLIPPSQLQAAALLACVAAHDIATETHLPPAPSFLTRPFTPRTAAQVRKLAHARAASTRNRAHNATLPHTPALNNRSSPTPYSLTPPAAPTGEVSITKALKLYDHTLITAAVELEINKVTTLFDVIRPISRSAIEPTAIHLRSSIFIKLKADGRLTARLAADGRGQTPDSYSDTYAGTSDTSARALILALMFAEAQQHNNTDSLDVFDFDITGAFLQNRLPRSATGGKQIVMRLPSDLPHPLAGTLVEVVGCLYGLKQSNNIFVQDLAATLALAHFYPTSPDPHIYIRSNPLDPTQRCIVNMHVDDGFGVSSCPLYRDELLSVLTTRYGPLTYNPECKFICGVNINRLPSGAINLSFERHITKLLTLSGMDNIPACATPSSSDLFSPSPPGPPPPSTPIKFYQSLLGSLIYLLPIRHDIAKEVTFPATKTTAPTTEHFCPPYSSPSLPERYTVINLLG